MAVWTGISHAYQPKMVEKDVDAIKEALFNLLTTAPKERWFECAYGNPAIFLLFEDLSAAFPALAIQKIRSYVSYYDPRIAIETIKIKQETDLGIVYLSIYFSWFDFCIHLFFSCGISRYALI